MRNRYRSVPMLILLPILGIAGTGPIQAQSHSVMHLSGSIDHRLAIEMTLERDGNKLEGFYFYNRIGRAIAVTGLVDKMGHVHLGEGTGSFDGTLVAGKNLTGTWRKAGSTHPLPFTLKVDLTSPSEQNIPGSAVLDEKTVRVRRPKNGEVYEVLIRYPVVRGHLDAVTVRKLNQALYWRSVYAPDDKLSDKNSWLDEIDYQINYDKHSILEVTYTVSGFGAYPDSWPEYRLLSLKTGAPIRAVDVFARGKLQTLANLVNKDVQREIKEALADADGMASDILEGRGRFNVEDLNHFSVSEKGLTFIFGYGFPHVIKASEPPGEFFYPFSTLKPYIRKDGPLAPFLPTD